MRARLSIAVVAASIAACSSDAFAGPKPGTFGTATMSWTWAEVSEDLDGLTLRTNQLAYLGELAPDETYVLQRDLTVRKGHLIPRGTLFALAMGDAPGLCEPEHRKDLRYVECFTHLDENGRFLESYPISLAVTSMAYVTTQNNFVGTRYFDSKKPLNQVVSMSDFQKSEKNARPVKLYLSLVKIDQLKSRVDFDICVASVEDISVKNINNRWNCANNFRVFYTDRYARFLTPFGSVELNEISASELKMKFVANALVRGN